MSQNKLRSTKPPGRLTLLTLTPIMAAMLTGAPISASAAAVSASVKYDKKLDVVVVTGKTDKTIEANSKVSVYDTANQVLLYTVNTNSTGKFKFNLPTTGGDYVPCSVRVETVNAKDNSQSKIVLPVGGVKTCSTSVACAITSPAQDAEITVGGSLNFAATPIKNKKGTTPATIVWKLGDGSADQKTNLVNHKFDQVGRYRVTLNAVDSNGNTQCSDDVIVSVIPPTGTNPNGKVPEQTKPGIAAAMPKADGTNDKDAYVVLPFEETGMQGGSQVNLPYNSMINYNSLNAQVIQKKEHKPPLINKTAVEVTYSAASNDKDPIGANSINSTSQNLFSSDVLGPNWDQATSKFDSKTQLPTDIKFIDGQDYSKALIRKSEQWDRVRQPLSVAQGKPQTSATFAEKQNTFTPALPVEKPDQGIRGYVDNGAGLRQMPGINNPFKANDPQKLDFNSYQDAFVAQFIPATDIDDQGRTNPFPLLRVQAIDKTTKEPLATTDAVYTTASETRCRECHTPGGIAADDNVWRIPVSEDELTDFVDPSKPGPATGRGNPGTGGPNISGYVDGSDATKSWPPAIHNKFDNKDAIDPAYTNLGVTLTSNPTSVTNIQADQNGLRTDRVKESRWVKLDSNGFPTNETSPTKPEGAGREWRLQIKVKFYGYKKYGGDTDNSWVNQEKAALFNTLIMHDYYVKYGPTPATGKDWPATFSTQVADNYGAEDIGKSPASPMYFCSGHHQSALKADVGVNGRTYATNRSDYSRAFHAFHGKFQVYKRDVTAAESADRQAHKKGDLIRDVRGHALEYGGRGWDSQKDDDIGVPLTQDADGKFTKKTAQTYNVVKNNWDPELYPMHPLGTSMLPFGKNIPVEENCAKCHTGPTEKSYRDIHHTAGLTCENCHSDMLAVGNVFGNEKYNANLLGGGAYGEDTAGKIDPTDFRRPWLDEPNCGSCHIGDANKSKNDAHFFSAGALNQAFVDGDKTGYSRDPMDARFAVMPTTSSAGNVEMRPEKTTATDADVAAGYKNPRGQVVTKGESFYKPALLSGALYRKSGDVHGTGPNGTLTCSTCHGGSHAIWPNQDPNANDNQTAKQLQGYDGNIAECSVCHIKDDFKTGLVATDGGDENLGVAQGVRAGTVVTPTGKDLKGAGKGRAYLAGPHGLHPVGDKYWYENAEGAAANSSPGKHTAGLNGGWHNDMASKPGPDGEDQCAACHGADHKGSRLSKTLTDRTLTNSAGKPVKVVKGQIIGCDLCHTLAKSFTGSPKAYNAKTEPTGGWPEALMHMPPAPDTFQGTAVSGGGHM